jgi:hypothetical protein
MRFKFEYKTPLQFAAKGGHLETMKLLFEKYGFEPHYEEDVDYYVSYSCHISY